MDRARSIHWEKIFAYRVFVTKRERKRPRGRPGSRWENDIKIDLGKTGMGR
jgi:hypothetical protein